MTQDYSINKILQIIKYYHIHMQNLKALERDMRRAGVSQYGEESALPRGNKISNIVENEALRQIENTKFWAEIITDIKYLQDRWHRITDEQEAMVLNLRLSGHSVRDIAQLMKMDRSNVYRMLRSIAKQIKGYPQANATNSTNFRKVSNF